MSETRTDSNDPYDKMITEAKRLSLEALLAGLDEDVRIAKVRVEINFIRAQLQEKPASSVS